MLGTQKKTSRYLSLVAMAENGWKTTQVPTINDDNGHLGPSFELFFQTPIVVLEYLGTYPAKWLTIYCKSTFIENSYHILARKQLFSSISILPVESESYASKYLCNISFFFFLYARIYNGLSITLLCTKYLFLRYFLVFTRLQND